MSLLDERELTAEERAAIADEPRPGVWIEEHIILTAAQNDGQPIVDRRGDGRTLDQAQTDSAIAAALFRLAGPEEQEQVLRAVVASLNGGRALDGVTSKSTGQVYATEQRGGIHSDPLVRLLAFRAWGDRDRRWTKRKTARALGRDVEYSKRIEVYRCAYGFDGVAVYDETWKQRWAYQATRGEREATVEVSPTVAIAKRDEDFLLDVFDELDAKLTAPR